MEHGLLVGTQALRLGGNLIMARLLVPDMFGIMAISTTLSVVLHLLSDVGLRQNIIQSPRGDDPLFLNTAWTVQLLRGILLFAVTLLIAFGSGRRSRSTCGQPDPPMPLRSCRWCWRSPAFPQ